MEAKDTNTRGAWQFLREIDHTLAHQVQANMFVCKKKCFQILLMTSGQLLYYNLSITAPSSNQ
jgi:hypothetical protein